MKITFLCSDKRHPVYERLEAWAFAQHGLHEVTLFQRKKELIGGDILFLISCNEIITYSDREKYSFCLVLHASDLPQGRGWSPHIWEILNGAESITLSLVEAEEKIDSGRIWKKIEITIPKHALWDEINYLVFKAEIELINYAIQNMLTIKPIEQQETNDLIYYSKRTPEDSRIDVNKSIADQFNLIRVCDPIRFPAYFEYLGNLYSLKLEKRSDR
jgi:methionyl-tRNA formyltransferase